MLSRPALLCSLAGLALVSGCAGDGSGPRGHLALSVTPLSLGSVGVACYDLRVAGSTDTVWARGLPTVTMLGHDQTAPADPLASAFAPPDGDTICSDRYGSGAGGDVVYIAPCDASPGADVTPGGDVQNTATLWVDGLYAADRSAEIGAWQDPCPNGCALTFACRENQDTAVTFDLTIMRDARQGFLDLAVTFDDIFCSAKLDSCYPNDTASLDDDRHIELLFGDDQQRDWTAVFGFACSGGDASPTTLAYGVVEVRCDDGVTFTIDPTRPAGSNLQTSSGPHTLHYGIYRGQELLTCDDPATEGVESCNKLYWNLAFDLADLATLGNCRLSSVATAFGADHAFIDGLPVGTGVTYPYVSLDAELALACQNNALNDGGAVETSYFGNVDGVPPPIPVCSQFDGTTATNVCELACTCPPGMLLDSDLGTCSISGTAAPIVNADQLGVCPGNSHAAYSMNGAHFHASFLPGSDEGNGCQDPDRCVEVRTEPWLGYLSDVGVWACGVGSTAGTQPVGTWIGFSRCVAITEAGDYLVGLAGDNKVLFRLDGQPLYASTYDDQNFKSWNVFKVHLDAGSHTIELFGRNNGSVAAFGAEIAGPFPVGSIDTPTDMAAADYAGRIIFSTRTLRGSNGTFDTSLDASEPIGTTCPFGFALDLCGVEPICRGSYQTACDQGPCLPEHHQSPLDCGCAHEVCAVGEVCTPGATDLTCEPVATDVATTIPAAPLVCARDEESSPDEFTVLGGIAYFQAEDGVGPQGEGHGAELWRTDGTTAGTYLVKDIHLGPGSSGLTNLTPLGTHVYFEADDGVVGDELWRSDGTEAGTTLVVDINLGEEGSDPEHLTPVGSTLFFSAWNPDANGVDLWRVDAGGAQLVKALSATGVSISSVAAYAGRLWFTTNDDVLWTSDGTEGGTAPFLVGGLEIRARSLTALGPALYFAGGDTSGWEPWVSDGTPTGTNRIANISPSFDSNPYGFVSLGGVTYFIASDGAPGLWRTDGTAGGTALVRAFAWEPSLLTASSSLLFFAAEDAGDGRELWRSDGTSAGTAMVVDVPDGELSPEDLTLVDGTLFFVANVANSGEELWVSDGTSAGTVRVSEVNSDPNEGGNLGGLEALGGTLIFNADDGIHGNEPWRSDGTEVGTGLLSNINTQALGSEPNLLTSFGDDLYFIATDCEHGEELWRWDGAQRTLVADIANGPMDSSPDWLLGVGDTLYFAANDGVHGYELWRTDGTTPGTRMVKDISPGDDSGGATDQVAVGTTLYFVSQDGVHGNEIWRSDGTDAGTYLLKDIVPGPFGPSPSNLTVVGSTLFFTAEAADAGRELWKSDGTTAGTVMVKDIEPGSDPSYPTELTVVGSRLYFMAVTSADGHELWTSDGTEGGTHLVADIVPGPGSSHPQSFAALGATLLFSANDGVHGQELWRTDGTPSGTGMVLDIAPGGTASYPSRFSATGPLVYFLASQDGGEELWVTDGTAGGTRITRDIVADGGSETNELITHDGKAYFSADDRVHGYELWHSNGTTWGTNLLYEVTPGPDSSSPELFVVKGDTLYFVARHPYLGTELWSVTISP